MLASHNILVGLCTFSGALAFFPGAPGFIPSITGLLPASMAPWQLTRYELQDKTGNRKAFHLEVAHS